MQDRLRNAILSIRSRDLNPASTIKILAQDLLDIHDLLSELHEEHFGAISELEPEPEPEPAPDMNEVATSSSYFIANRKD
tara:strand:- start:9855 stop:10094 length:240 start_codon:yes stop_codon:yes gene_type:complete